MRRLKGLTLENGGNSTEVTIPREHLGKIENDYELLRSVRIGTVLDLVKL